MSQWCNGYGEVPLADASLYAANLTKEAIAALPGYNADDLPEDSNVTAPFLMSKPWFDITRRSEHWYDYEQRLHAYYTYVPALFVSLALHGLPQLTTQIRLLLLLGHHPRLRYCPERDPKDH